MIYTTIKLNAQLIYFINRTSTNADHSGPVITNADHSGPHRDLNEGKGPKGVLNGSEH